MVSFCIVHTKLCFKYFNGPFILFHMVLSTCGFYFMSLSALFSKWTSNVDSAHLCDRLSMNTLSKLKLTHFWRHPPEMLHFVWN